MSVSGLNKRHLRFHINFRINNVSIKMLVVKVRRSCHGYLVWFPAKLFFQKKYLVPPKRAGLGLIGDYVTFLYTKIVLFSFKLHLCVRLKFYMENSTIFFMSLKFTWRRIAPYSLLWQRLFSVRLCLSPRPVIGKSFIYIPKRYKF